MPDKFFPIKTDTACQLKWNWSTLYLYDAKTASCHRAGVGDLTSEKFENFHNTEKKQQERRLMLQGQWPVESCRYCRKIEESGGFSDRMLHLNVPNMAPKELDSDPTAVNVTPTILEVFFDNTCNLSCVYCFPELSSKINQEYNNFGPLKLQGVELKSITKNENYSALLEKFWTWMDKNSLDLRRFNVLGGEPFYQNEFYKLIDYIDRKPHPDLELGIVTNLMIAPDKLEEIINKFKSLLSRKHLKRVDLSCSIDCWGKEQEYVRYGINLNTWEKNFESLLSYKWLTLNINQTISVLTIKTMPELLKKLEQWRKRRRIGHFFSAVTPHPLYLMPHIMGPGVFDTDFEHIVELMPNLTEQDLYAISCMQGIKQRIEFAEPNVIEKSNLKLFLDENDRRRGTNWKDTFPWLVKELDNVV